VSRPESRRSLAVDFDLDVRGEPFADETPAGDGGSLFSDKTPMR
jgi:hypothetical protein